LAGGGEAGVEHIVDGLACRVVKGTHAGKSGTVEDRKLSETGHVTVTIRLADGDRIKTLARNVVAA
jgi:ribosomal protein S4E